MNRSRRQVLKGVSTLGAIAAMGAEPLLAANPVKSPVSSGSLPWPKPIGSPVIESLRPVIEGSRDVKTHYDKIVDAARWMAYEELPMPHMAVPYGLDKNPDVAIDFIMVSNTINSAFTDFKTHIKFQTDYADARLSDSDAMVACLKRAMDNGIPILDGKFLAKVSRPEMEKLFAGNMEMPMLDEKMAVFHQAGEVLAAKYDGRYVNFVKSCPPRLYDNGNGLVDRLVKEFPRFNDVSQFDGHQVKFYKLAQLGYWGMYSGLGRTSGFKLEDPQKLSAFADYIVPVALRLMGMTSYSPALEKAINSYQMIPRDSRQEIEIRAHSLYATALLAEEVNRLRPADQQVIIPQIDARIWTHYHTTFWPHHLTKTIMY
ncbi:MAG TPA: queuosine salvage family protein [Candidatus Sulfotelmatobacter sp.]|nr:queuosine salvage family protein [Candidatus Sulfotelmatobacter sp.]